MNAVTSRISVSQCAAEVRTDDPPISAVVDELELEAIEVALHPVEQPRARSLADHAGMHDGACGVLPLERDLVDAAHDLDALVRDEVAVHDAQSLAAVIAARIAVG